jgi:aminoglycoside phosphotransferase family enzyme/predicted kinase
MIAEDQTRTIAFLTDPATSGAAAETIATVETHIAVVVLAGGRAFKLKRAVKLPYLDFSTPAQRLAACRLELDLNRRTAPGLYRAVRTITREADGRLAFDGGGEIVDAVVEMVRFDEAGLFDRLAARGDLTPALLTELSGEIARFHAEAEISRAVGGAANMASVLDINERALATTSVFPAASVARFDAAFRASLERHAALLDARGRVGKIRRCHGDLHLRNICLFEGRPLLFDCLEFDEAMATTDVLYDLAFLLMDLWHRGCRAEANLVLNRYLDAADETDGLPLLPFFMAVRAAVRAHVTATRIEEADGGTAALREEAAAYFALAESLLDPPPARLVAVGGLSGSGKSTVAAAIADRVGPPPGARVLASDRIRKRLFAVAAETRLADEAYRPEVSERVYATLAREAGDILRLGHGVVADAVFDRAPDRARIAGVASEAGTAFRGLWLAADPEVLFARVGARRGGPSDADAGVLAAQLRRRPEVEDWPHVEAGGTPAESAARAAALLRAGDEG